MNPRKTLLKIESGSANIPFNDVVSLLKAMGFTEDRVRGSHHIFSHPEVPEVLNLQPRKGQAKPYQLRQILAVIQRHGLSLGELP